MRALPAQGPWRKGALRGPSISGPRCRCRVARATDDQAPFRVLEAGQALEERRRRFRGSDAGLDALLAAAGPGIYVVRRAQPRRQQTRQQQQQPGAQHQEPPQQQPAAAAADGEQQQQQHAAAAEASSPAVLRVTSAARPGPLRGRLDALLARGGPDGAAATLSLQSRRAARAALSALALAEGASGAARLQPQQDSKQQQQQQLWWQVTAEHVSAGAASHTTTQLHVYGVAPAAEGQPHPPPRPRPPRLPGLEQQLRDQRRQQERGGAPACPQRRWLEERAALSCEHSSPAGGGGPAGSPEREYTPAPGARQIAWRLLRRLRGTGAPAALCCRSPAGAARALLALAHARGLAGAAGFGGFDIHCRAVDVAAAVAAEQQEQQQGQQQRQQPAWGQEQQQQQQPARQAVPAAAAPGRQQGAPGGGDAKAAGPGDAPGWLLLEVELLPTGVLSEDGGAALAAGGAAAASEARPRPRERRPRRPRATGGGGGGGGGDQMAALAGQAGWAAELASELGQSSRSLWWGPGLAASRQQAQQQQQQQQQRPGLPPREQQQQPAPQLPPQPPPQPPPQRMVHQSSTGLQQARPSGIPASSSSGSGSSHGLARGNGGYLPPNRPSHHGPGLQPHHLAAPGGELLVVGGGAGAAAERVGVPVAARVGGVDAAAAAAGVEN